MDTEFRSVREEQSYEMLHREKKYNVASQAAPVWKYLPC